MRLAPKLYCARWLVIQTNVLISVSIALNICIKTKSCQTWHWTFVARSINFRLWDILTHIRKFGYRSNYIFHWKQEWFTIRLQIPHSFHQHTLSLTNESPALSVSTLFLKSISSNSTNVNNNFFIFKYIQHEIHHICKQKLLHNFNLIKL